MKKLITFFKVFLIFSIFFLTNFKVYSEEIFKPFIDLKKPISIEMNSNQYNKYIKTLFKAFMGGNEGQKLNNIEKKYKKWINAKINHNNKKLNIKLRITGEWKDHLDLNIPGASLKIKVIDGTFHGLKKFKLFLPKTRKETNEIFWSLSLKQFGLPIYHTQYVNVEINGIKYKAIFQEESSKEFLERNAFRETAIFRSNDQVAFNFSEETNQLRKIYYIDDAIFLDNGNFIKNKESIKIVSNAIGYRNLENFSERVKLNQFFIEASNKYAPHGNYTINRKYIFNPLDSSFTPLYYDGMMGFFYNYDYECKTTNLEKQNKLNKEFFAHSGRKLNSKEICVFEDLNRIFNKYKDNSNYFLTDNFNFKYEKKYNFIRNEIIKFIKSNNQLSNKVEKSGLLYSLSYKNEYYLCLFKVEIQKINSCKKLDFAEYKKYLTSITNPYSYKSYKGLSVFNLGTLDLENNKIILNNNKDKFILNENKLYIYEPNETFKELKFNFLNSDARLVVIGKSKNQRYIFNNSSEQKLKNNLKSRYNQNLLTGCITFYKHKFENTEIYSKNIYFCEDTINIMNSRGEISAIEISDSEFDGLDIDASELDLKKVSINNSGNDCFDLSFGQYNLRNINIKNCLDKGISIGERSNVSLSDFIISNTDIGIATKDSSFLKMNNGELNQTKTYCLTAYNKKEEFGPSTINFKNIKCEGKNFFEEGSVIND